MSTRKSITPGDVFGRLTVLSEAPRRGYSRYWLCQCSCGSLPKEIRYGSLGASSKSCGCLARELAAKRAVQSFKLNTTHGKVRTPEYAVWHSMWQRCTNLKNAKYESYKDRAPPEKWRAFQVFFADMGPRPSAKHSIERVDNDKPYGPDNCVWATSKDQSRNKSTNVKIEYQGRTKCVTAWAEEFKIKRTTLDSRLKAGWSIEKALNTKVGN